MSHEDSQMLSEQPKAPASIFRETREGGRWANRQPIPGEIVGESKVLRSTTIVEGHQIWEVLCPCGKTQLRTSGSINTALRRGGSILCPECLRELRSGGFLADWSDRSTMRIERVLNGGPIWTAEETAALQTSVRRGLEEEFGPLDEERPHSLVDMQLDLTGWPYSAQHTLSAIEHAKRQAERAEEREIARRQHLTEVAGQIRENARLRESKVAAELLTAIVAAEAGDTEKLDEALTLERKFAEELRRQRRPVAPIKETWEHMLPMDLLEQHPRITKCPGCGQRRAWIPAREKETCNTACETRAEGYYFMNRVMAYANAGKGTAALFNEHFPSGEDHARWKKYCGGKLPSYLFGEKPRGLRAELPAAKRPQSKLIGLPRSRQRHPLPKRLAAHAKCKNVNLLRYRGENWELTDIEASKYAMTGEVPKRLQEWARARGLRIHKPSVESLAELRAQLEAVEGKLENFDASTE